MCIFLPYLFLIVSLICWTFVGIGCTTSSASLARLHFMKVSKTNIFENTVSDSTITGFPDEFYVGSRRFGYSAK